MAFSRVTYETRPVNLADCTKGAPECHEITDCGVVQCLDQCGLNPLVGSTGVVGTLIISSSCPCFNGSWPLIFCGSCLRTYDARNRTYSDCPEAAPGYPDPDPNQATVCPDGSGGYFQVG